MAGTPKGRGMRLYPTSDQFRLACLSYVDWCLDNPIIYEGMEKPRPMTMMGLFKHLGMSQSTFNEYSHWPIEKGNYADVCDEIRTAIASHQLEYGLLNIYNSTLVCRINGLSDKVENDHKSTDGSMSPTRVELVSPNANSKD